MGSYSVVWPLGRKTASGGGGVYEHRVVVGGVDKWRRENATTPGKRTPQGMSYEYVTPG